MPWFLNLVYLIAFAAALPWLLYRRFWLGKPVAGFRIKLTGSVPELRATERRIWFHAVSVGEVLLLSELISQVRRRHPDIAAVISTTTGTGFEVAKKLYPDLPIFFFPFDFSWSCKRAIQRIRPTAIILAELEVWPNFLLAASMAGVPVAVANGRLSEKSFNGYCKLSLLLRPLMRHLSFVAAQSEVYATRFRALGTPSDRVIVTGSLKFDRALSDRANPATETLRSAFGLSKEEVTLIAGSTGDPEEQYALHAWQKLRMSFPLLRLILVPRHKERFEEVARLVENSGLPLLRKSRLSASNLEGTSENENKTPPVILLDTLGELGACWGLAEIAFVGGSLTNRGGQNMIEPAAFGAAVLFGPDTRNFRDAVDLLLSNEAAQVVRNECELREAIQSLLLDPERRQQMGQRAQAAIATHRGATAKHIELIEAKLLEPTQMHPARAA